MMTPGSGYAAAARPVSTGTIVTSDAGLDAAVVEIPTPNGPIAGYRAVRSNGDGRAPVVVVVHEIFGLHEHIKDVCRRFAQAGYFAVAPDLFARQGDATKLTDMKQIQETIVSKVPDAQVLADLDATVAWIAEQAAADPARLGLTGFCWGGRFVWLYAGGRSSLRAGVAWYGRLTGGKDVLRPEHPLDVAAKLNVPVLGFYGGQDTSIPLASVEQMREALAGGSQAAQRSAIHVYPDAGHAFFADYRPTYKPREAADAWNRALGWFQAHGIR